MTQEIKQLKTLLKSANQQLHTSDTGDHRSNSISSQSSVFDPATPGNERELIKYGYNRFGGSLPTVPRDVFIQRRLEKLSGHMQVSNGRQTYLGATNWEAMAATSLTVHASGYQSPQDHPQYKRPGSYNTLSHSRFPFQERADSPFALFELFFMEGAYRSLVKFIFNHFFEDVHKFYHCFHRPTITKQIDMIFEHGCQGVPLHWMSLLLAVLTLSATCLSSEQCSQLADMGWMSSRPELVKTLRNTAEQILVADNFLKEYSYENVQALLFLQIADSIDDSVGVSWPMLGLVVRMAQSIGLHRDPELFSRDVIENETRRRTWHLIVSFDRVQSANSGRPVAVCDEDCDTRHPLNVNDDDISDTMETPPESPSLATYHSDLSFMLCRFRVTELLSRVFRIVYAVKRPSYSVALELDLEIRAALNNIPEYFRPNLSNTTWTPQVEIQSCIVSGLLLRTSIILHQPFLREAVCRYTHNDMYAQSKIIGLATCRSLLKCQMARYNNPTLSDKYDWYLNGPILFQVINGACLLALVLCSDNKYPEAAEDWALLQESLQTYNRIASVSKVAERAVAMLTPIYERIRPKMTPQSPSMTPAMNPTTELADGVISWDEWDKLFSEFDFTPNVECFAPMKTLNDIAIDVSG